MPSAYLFTTLFLSANVVSLILGFLVIRNNRKAAVSRCFFALILSLNFWSLGLAFANIAADAATCEIWRRYSSLGWGTVYSIILHFAMLITGKTALLKKPWFPVLLYLPAVLTVLAYGIPSGLNPEPYHLIQTEFGWINLSKVVEYNLWDWIFFVYYISYTIAALVLVFRWGRQASEYNVKMQARALLLSLSVAFVLASATDILLSNNLVKMPQIAPIILLIPVMTIHRIMKKYAFIASDPLVKKGNLLHIIAGVAVYILIAFVQVSLSGNGSMPASGLGSQAYLGILTQIQMMISICLVLKEDIPGYWAAVLLNAGNILISVNIMVQIKSTSPMPGTISYAGVLMIITLIVFYKKKTAASIDKIDQQRARLKESEKRLYQMAYYDSLTRLHNRDWFVEHLDASIQKAKGNDTLVSVIFIDLDSFKSINDTMGHSSGDAALKLIAERLSSCLKETDAIARFGGDEFLIMIADICDEEELRGVVDRIMEIFSNPILLQHIEYFITASVGVAVCPTDGENAEALIKNADIAMYLAKSIGRNQCVFCSSDIKSQTVKTMKLTNNLYKALDNRELFLQYQPQVATKTQEIKGFEALLRWNNEEYGIITPDVFIPMAEHTGLIRPIGLWVFRTACQQLKVFQQVCGRKIGMTVNLSLEQLRDYEIAEEISAILNETNTDAQDIQIEITESTAFNEDPFVLQQVKDIKMLGISVAIDDFGTGFSSFTRLKTFPIDLLKIDIGFVRGIGNGSRKDEAIIKSIIQIAENLEIEVLAEGVETETQFHYLRKNGCDLIQGYYFHRPLSVGEALRLLEKQKRNSLCATGHLETI